MSEYRDDVLDRLRITDSLIAGLYGLVVERVRIRDSLPVGLVHLVDERLQLSDSVIDRVGSVLVDRLYIRDSIDAQLIAVGVVGEQLTINDQVLERLATVAEERLQVSDSVVDRVSGLLTESLHIASEPLGQRIVRDLAIDRLAIRDKILGVRQDLVSDELRISDLVLSKAVGRALLVERVHIGDLVLDQVLQRIEVLTSRARISDQVIGSLLASNVVIEPIHILDEVLQWGDFGQAWTAELSSWAMSRYAPFTMTGLAVIDGVLYATGPGGVYALDGADEQIVAALQTGKLDTGGDRLVRPIESHIEYELDGVASMDVAQTQSGSAAETYTYNLPAWHSAELTNERFRFGRGLRGRHFAYTLRLTGKSAYLNDWKVLAEPSKRSL